jgi:hypothetical protein
MSAEEKTDLKALEAVGRVFDAVGLKNPSAQDTAAFSSLLIGQAIREIKDLRRALAEPCEGLDGTFPVVLFLRNDEDREELVRLLQQSNPNLRARNL